MVFILLEGSHFADDVGVVEAAQGFACMLETLEQVGDAKMMCDH